MKVIRSIKVWTEGFRKVNESVEDFVVLYEFFEAGDASEEEIDEQYMECITQVEELETHNMLRKKEDNLGAVDLHEKLTPNVLDRIESILENAPGDDD